MNENTINNDVTMAGESERALLANRYRIIKQLGQGGMGSVWLAEDTQLDGKLFAIKMLPSILVSNKRAYAQLKSEALVAMKLVHPNIVQIRAFEENDGNPFLVMDYIDGETLDEWLGDRVQELGVREGERPREPQEVWPGRSPLREAKSLEACDRPHEPLLNVADIIRLLKPIAEAIDYAHTEGVVHRDIKPANVMIRKDGRPFIMDFGIAREIQETLTRVTGKMSSGTLMYMSPEQLNGDVPKPSQDVYSFAAMVYECLKGEPPFCRGNIEFQIMNKEPEPLTYGSYGPDEVRFAEQSRKRPASVLASHVQDSCSIASSVMAALAKKPEDRPKNCLAVLGGAYGNREKELESGVSSQESGDRSQESGDREVWPGRSPLRGAKSLEACERTREPRGGLFGNIAVISLLVFGLVGGIWYWQGTHENEVVSDSLIPAKPSAKTNPPPPPPPSPPLSGPTELDVMEIKVESSAQKGRIERIDDADGFKIKKDGLSDLYLKAVAYENAKSWSSAAVHYTNYVKGCDKLITLDGERKAAKEKYSMAFASQRLAANAESSKYASARWGEALDVMKKASEHFSQMKFSDAKGFYESAVKQFELCVGEAKIEREREKKDRIRRMKWRQEGESYTIEPDGLNLTMKWCPAGSFMMGSPASEAGRKGYEVLHNVTLTKGYWLGETEVTQGQWKRIMDNETVVDLARKGLYDDTACVWDGSKFVTLRELWKIEQDGDPMSRCGDLNDNIPVYNLSWYEAVEFCKRLTESERAAGRIPDGYEYRLPTESEWEYACRAGTTAALPNGYDMVILGVSDAYSLDDIAWYSGNSSVGFSGRGVDTSNWKEKQYKGGVAFAREVKGKQPNNWGFFDMIGNVREWCYDKLGKYPNAGVDPIGLSSSKVQWRVVRGGGWNSYAYVCRSAMRQSNYPSARNYDVGFRVALAPSHPGMIYPEAPVITVPKVDEKVKNKQFAKQAFKVKKYSEAFRLFMKSDLEDNEVQWFLGRMYHRGNGVDKDYDKAISWYRKSANKGNVMAQKDLGMCYDIGHGVEKNEQEALKWYRKAAEQGDSFSQNILGNMYQSGRGVLKDYYEAVKWYRKSAETGNMFALWNLGGMYERGCGVQKDIEEAKECYRKAAEKGHKNAKEALERLENVSVVQPVRYVQPVVNQPQQPELIDRPYNLKYCDNCGHELWRYKKISPRCEKCGTILFTPEAPPKDTTGKDVEALGNLLRGIGGGL